MLLDWIGSNRYCDAMMMVRSRWCGDPISERDREIKKGSNPRDCVKRCKKKNWNSNGSVESATPNLNWIQISWLAGWHALRTRCKKNENMQRWWHKKRITRRLLSCIVIEYSKLGWVMQPSLRYAKWDHRMPREFFSIWRNGDFQAEI